MKKKLLVILLLVVISISLTGCLSMFFPEPNNPPVITPIPDATITVGETFTYTVEVVDPDEGDTLIFSLTTTPSTNMDINPTTGVINWTPAATGNIEVTVEVSDGKSSDTESFTVTVIPAPVGPSNIDLTPLTATVGVEYTGIATATPGDNTALTFSLVGAPSGMEISTDGVITWTPTVAGEQAVTVVVTDGAGLSDSQSFTIVVSTANHAPVINFIPDASVTAGENFTYTVEAVDPEGDDLIYSLTTSPTTNMAIDEDSGVISWTPTAVGNFDVTVEVSDGELSSTQSFAVEVIAPNRVVMFELFEGPACSRCKKVHPDIVRLRQEYGLDELVILEEYGWDISGYTGWGIKDVRDRYYEYIYYLDIGGYFPDAYFNGINQTVHYNASGYNNYKSAIEAELAKPTKIAISASCSVTGKTVNISGNIVNISSGTLNNLVIEAMVYEDSVYSEYRGYNVDHVVRDIITYEESGEQIASFSSGGSREFSLTSSYLSNVHNINNIHVVVYVQAPSSPTMEILQALYVE
ncbi:hypothetical protein CVT91_11435 [Candidatus Atribacteria bacterium HGW-Atribacteria-1]|nr:MAG: hypothetical protein CVT91_11435 [Candidatus Atribacteria bacterium HGW-Atribacteria-1]